MNIITVIRITIVISFSIVILLSLSLSLLRSLSTVILRPWEDPGRADKCLFLFFQVFLGVLSDP